WSNDKDSQSIDVGEGTYTVTVTDSNGCTGTDEVTVIENANPEPSITGSLEYCASELTTTLDAGTWTSYLWSNDQATHSTDVGEGTYTVTVTDSNGCTGTDQVTVIENANPQPKIGGELSYCRGREATLDAGTWTSYLWSNSLTIQSFSTTVTGIYTVTVTDSNGCTGTDMVGVSQTPCLAEAGTLTTNAATICAGGNIEVSTTNEQTATNYSLYFFLYTQDNLGNTTFVESMIANVEMGESSADFSGLEAGDYLVCSYNECQDCLPNPSPITTDLDDIYETGSIQDGCYDIECSTINVPEAFEPNLAGSGAAPQTGTGMNIFIAEVCGGSAPYSFDFSFLGGFASIQELPSDDAGCINYQVTYSNGVDWTLTVTDDNSCSNESTTFTSDGLPSNPLPQITGFTTTQETCPGDKDGSITIEVSGGDDSCDEYTYNWSGPGGFSENNTDDPTGSTLDDLASGTYNVTVTDCSGTTTVQEGIYVSRANTGGRGGRGRNGGCKTAGEEAFNEISQMNVYPNPFAERTLIEFSLSVTSNVWLSVYSMDGRKVAQLLEGEKIGANILQRFSLEATELASGVYVLQLYTDKKKVWNERLIVLE
ncbi:MAG: T9SS type A sorting domain-containing protein, partial [Chitinophagales bacterium]